MGSSDCSLNSERRPHRAAQERLATGTPQELFELNITGFRSQFSSEPAGVITHTVVHTLRRHDRAHRNAWRRACHLLHHFSGREGRVPSSEAVLRSADAFDRRSQSLRRVPPRPLTGRLGDRGRSHTHSAQWSCVDIGSRSVLLTGAPKTPEPYNAVREPYRFTAGIMSWTCTPLSRVDKRLTRQIGVFPASRASRTSFSYRSLIARVS